MSQLLPTADLFAIEKNKEEENPPPKMQQSQPSGARTTSAMMMTLAGLALAMFAATQLPVVGEVHTLYAVRLIACKRMV